MGSGWTSTCGTSAPRKAGTPSKSSSTGRPADLISPLVVQDIEIIVEYGPYPSTLDYAPASRRLNARHHRTNDKCKETHCEGLHHRHERRKQRRSYASNFQGRLGGGSALHRAGCRGAAQADGRAACQGGPLLVGDVHQPVGLSHRAISPHPGYGVRGAGRYDGWRGRGRGYSRRRRNLHLRRQRPVRPRARPALS